MFFGRVFNYPDRVFTPEMLKPETQDMAQFADGMDNIASTQRLVAQAYFADGGVEMACPPLRALLHIMRDGNFGGKTLGSPEVRELFDPAKALASDWYRERLEAAAQVDRRLWRRHVKNLQTFLRRPHNGGVSESLGIPERLAEAMAMLEKAESPGHAESLRGTIGAHPLG
jgi:hypothetical protein